MKFILRLPLEKKNEEPPIRLSVIASIWLSSAGRLVRRSCDYAWSDARGTPLALSFKPNYEKIVELLLHLAHVRPNADKYQAVKLFYLADKEHLEKFGRPITFETYYALKYGPVASNVMDLLERDRYTFKKANITALPFNVQDVSDKNAPSKATITYIREPLREVDRDLFSLSDLNVFDGIIREHGNKTFEQLFDLTHSHEAYNDAWDHRGYRNRALMDYSKMIENKQRRADLVEDLEPVSLYMK